MPPSIEGITHIQGFQGATG